MNIDIVARILILKSSQVENRLIEVEKRTQLTQPQLSSLT